MIKKIANHNMPIGKLTRVKDFLPPPGDLITPKETVKVTISLKKGSIDFFKREAAKHKTKYQKMIREVLDQYVTRYSAS